MSILKSITSLTLASSKSIRSIDSNGQGQIQQYNNKIQQSKNNLLLYSEFDIGETSIKFNNNQI